MHVARRCITALRIRRSRIGAVSAGDWPRTTIACAPSRSSGEPLDSGSPEDLEGAQAIVVLGQSPAETAPILDLRIRKAVMHRRATCIAIATLDPAPPYACQTVDSVRAAIDALPKSA